MKQGSALNIVTQDMDVHEVKVNGCSGSCLYLNHLGVECNNLDRYRQKYSIHCECFLDEEEI